MHMYHHPEDAEDETFCLTRFPKRVKEKPQVPKHDGVRAGWGINYVEGMHRQKVYASGMVTCLLSLSFGVAWTILKDDIQTFLACAIGLLQATEQ